LPAYERFLTSRLLLRKPLLLDAEAVFSAYASDAQVTRYVTWRQHESAEITKGFLTRCLREWADGSHLSYIITPIAEPSRPLGMISVRRKQERVLFGYVLSQRVWGRGFATEALSYLVNWSLAQEGVWRASAFCDVDNTASARVMEKSGLSFEGLLRRYIMHPNVSDEPRDCLMYAKVR